jgi:hypothetical protein
MLIAQVTTNHLPLNAAIVVGAVLFIAAFIGLACLPAVRSEYEKAGSVSIGVTGMVGAIVLIAGFFTSGSTYLERIDTETPISEVNVESHPLNQVTDGGELKI